MKFRFKLGDFDYVDERSERYVVSVANKILDAHLATLPKIGGYKSVNQPDILWGNGVEIDDTHQAILFDVEELERRECEHYPRVRSKQVIPSSCPGTDWMLGCAIYCSKCGVQVRPSGWQTVGP